MLLCEMNARAMQHKYWPSMLCNEASRTVAKYNIALPLLLRFFDPVVLFPYSSYNMYSIGKCSVLCIQALQPPSCASRRHSALGMLLWSLVSKSVEFASLCSTPART